MNTVVGIILIVLFGIIAIGAARAGFYYKSKYNEIKNNFDSESRITKYVLNTNCIYSFATTAIAGSCVLLVVLNLLGILC